MQARYEPVDLAAVTAELASIFAPPSSGPAWPSSVDCPPLPEPVYVDREHVGEDRPEPALATR